jgi:hypothetical protein
MCQPFLLGTSRRIDNGAQKGTIFSDGVAGRQQDLLPSPMTREMAPHAPNILLLRGEWSVQNARVFLILK